MRGQCKIRLHCPLIVNCFHFIFRIFYECNMIWYEDYVEEVKKERIQHNENLLNYVPSP